METITDGLKYVKPNNFYEITGTLKYVKANNYYEAVANADGNPETVRVKRIEAMIVKQGETHSSSMLIVPSHSPYHNLEELEKLSDSQTMLNLQVQLRLKKLYRERGRLSRNCLMYRMLKYYHRKFER